MKQGFWRPHPTNGLAAITLLRGDGRRRQQMGLLARQRVEAEYSVAAWAETFVTSMTGNMPPGGLGLPGKSIGRRRRMLVPRLNPTPSR